MPYLAEKNKVTFIVETPILMKLRYYKRSAVISVS